MIFNIIGKKPADGSAVETNKWYVGFEIRKCPPEQFQIFRPAIFMWCVKFMKPSQPHAMRDPNDKVGGFKSFVSPIGIVFRIEIYF